MRAFFLLGTRAPLEPERPLEEVEEEIWKDSQFWPQNTVLPTATMR